MSDSKLSRIKQSVIALINDQRWDEARKKLEDAARKFPKDFEVWFFLSAVCGQLNALDESAKYCRKALSIQPDNANAHYNYGMALTRLGDLRGAAEAYRKSIESNPDNPAAHQNLGNVLRSLGEHSGALEHLVKSLDLDPARADAMFSIGTIYMELGQHDDALKYLNECKSVNPELRSKAEYFIAGITGEFDNGYLGNEHVKNLHDKHAGYFDEHLTQVLGYKIPSILLEEYNSVIRKRERKLSILDLGCGTGLCGRVFRQQASHITGVDLSPGMLERARDTGAYDDLIQAELMQFLKQDNSNYDLVLSADVFIYVGDITGVLEVCAERLNENGCMVFSVESTQGPGYRLGSSGRFAHSNEYVNSVAENAGLKLLSARPVMIRKEHNIDIEGYVYILQKYPRAALFARV